MRRGPESFAFAAKQAEEDETHTLTFLFQVLRVLHGLFVLAFCGTLGLSDVHDAARLAERQAAFNFAVDLCDTLASKYAYEWSLAPAAEGLRRRSDWCAKMLATAHIQFGLADYAPTVRSMATPRGQADEAPYTHALHAFRDTEVTGRDPVAPAAQDENLRSAQLRAERLELGHLRCLRCGRPLHYSAAHHSARYPARWDMVDVRLNEQGIARSPAPPIPSELLAISAEPGYCSLACRMDDAPFHSWLVVPTTASAAMALAVPLQQRLDMEQESSPALAVGPEPVPVSVLAPAPAIPPTPMVDLETIANELGVFGADVTAEELEEGMELTKEYMPGYPDNIGGRRRGGNGRFCGAPIVLVRC